MSSIGQNANVKDNMELIHLLNDIRMTTDMDRNIDGNADSLVSSLSSQQVHVFYDDDGLPMDDFLYALKHHHSAGADGLGGAKVDFCDRLSKETPISNHQGIVPNVKVKRSAVDQSAKSAVFLTDDVADIDPFSHIATHSHMTNSCQNSENRPVGEEDNDDNDSVLSSISDYINRNMTATAAATVETDDVIKPHVRMQAPVHCSSDSMPQKDDIGVRLKATGKPKPKKAADLTVTDPSPSTGLKKNTKVTSKGTATSKKTQKKPISQLQQYQQRQSETVDRMSSEQLHKHPTTSSHSHSCSHDHCNSTVAEDEHEQNLTLMARNKSLNMRLQGQLQTIRELEYRCLTLKSQDDEKESLIKSLHKKIHVLVTQAQAQAVQIQEVGIGSVASSTSGLGVGTNAIAALKSQLIHAQQKLAEQTTISNQLKDAHGTLLTKHNEAARQQKFQEERYRLLKQYAEKMKNKTQELDACLQSQESTLQALQRANKTLKLTGKEYCTDSAALREVLQQKDAEIQQWKYRTEKVQDSLSQTQAQLKQCKAEKRELRLELSAAADRTAQYNQLLERNREEGVRRKLQQRLDDIGSGNRSSRSHMHSEKATLDHGHGHGYDQPTASWVHHTGTDNTGTVSVTAVLPVRQSIVDSTTDHVRAQHGGGLDTRRSRSASPAIVPVLAPDGAANNDIANPTFNANANTNTNANACAAVSVATSTDTASAGRGRATRVSTAPFYARHNRIEHSATNSCNNRGDSYPDSHQQQQQQQQQPPAVSEPSRADSIEASTVVASIDDSDSREFPVQMETQAEHIQDQVSQKVAPDCEVPCAPQDSSSSSRDSTNTILNSVDLGKRERYNRLKLMYDRIVSKDKDKNNNKGHGDE